MLIRDTATVGTVLCNHPFIVQCGAINAEGVTYSLSKVLVVQASGRGEAVNGFTMMRMG